MIDVTNEYDVSEEVVEHDSTFQMEEEIAPDNSNDAIHVRSMDGNTYLMDRNTINWEETSNNIGIMYYHGHGVGKNYSQAFHWYTLAAEQGHIAAQYNIAIMYEQGIGTEKDRAKAKQWFKKAADQGYEPARKRMQNL